MRNNLSDIWVYQLPINNKNKTLITVASAAGPRHEQG